MGALRRRWAWLACLVLALVSACRSAGDASGAPGGGPRLAHDVYFTLREDTPAERAALGAACRKLAQLEGVLALDVGERVAELARPVNDQTFDVGLHVLFADRAAHDRYQVAPEHVALLAEWGPRFESVRVFDFWVE